MSRKSSYKIYEQSSFKIFKISFWDLMKISEWFFIKDPSQKELLMRSSQHRVDDELHIFGVESKQIFTPPHSYQIKRENYFSILNVEDLRKIFMWDISWDFGPG